MIRGVVGGVLFGGSGTAGEQSFSFEGSALPSGVSVAGASLVSGFGSDGLLAWPAHNLISPSPVTSGSGWTPTNSSFSGGIYTFTAANSALTKSATSGLKTFTSGEKLLARLKAKAANISYIGRTFDVVAANSTSAFTASTRTTATLTADYATVQSLRTCAESSADQRFGILTGTGGGTAPYPCAMQITDMQLSAYPMSPDRFVTTTDASSPYDPVYAELFDHFQTTGVRRGLRVKSGVDTATVSLGAAKAGIYDVTYIWLDTDEATELAQTVEQYAALGVLTLSPPIGEHILRLEIRPSLTLTLTEFSSNGLVFGVSNGTTAGADASAPILLQGTAQAGRVIEARVRQGATVIEDWHSIGTSLPDGTFAFKTNRVPRGEGYTAEVRLQSIQSAVATMVNTFHCRDLIVTTGSSNMANGYSFNGGSAVTSFTNEFKTYNGNQTVTMFNTAYGGSRLYDAVGASNCWYSVPDMLDTSGITQWQDFGLNDRGAIHEAAIREIGGEVTAFMNASGGNDLGLAQDAEEARVWKLAQSRKFELANSLSGRTIPFIQQELGIRCLNLNATDDLWQQQVRMAQAEMVGVYPSVVIGGVMWDQPLETNDGQHLDSYDEVWERNCRCIIDSIGYASGLQVRGPYVSSAAKTDTTTIVAQVTLRGGTAITPSSGMTGWRVMDNGVQKTISSVSVGAAVAGVVPVTIVVSGAMTGPTVLTYRYGNGTTSVASTTDWATMNAGTANTGKDNGTYTLPIENMGDGLTVI